MMHKTSGADELARVDKSSPQTTWDSGAKILRTVAKKTVGLRPKQVKNKGIFDPAIDHMWKEQKDLRLRIENTKNETTRAELRKRRNKILHEMRKRTLIGKRIVVSVRAGERDITLSRRPADV